MSMNIMVIHPTLGELSVLQTPTDVTFKIIEASDKRQAYFDWVAAIGLDDDFKSEHIERLTEFWDSTCNVEMI